MYENNVKFNSWTVRWYEYNKWIHKIDKFLKNTYTVSWAIYDLSNVLVKIYRVTNGLIPQYDSRTKTKQIVRLKHFWDALIQYGGLKRDLNA